MTEQELKKQVLSARKGVGRRVPPRLSDELNKHILALRAEGLACARIAERLGIDESTVAKRLREVGRGTGRSLSRFTPEELAFMREHAEAGYSVAAIAEALGRGAGAIRNRLDADGVEYENVPRGGPRAFSPRIYNGGPARVDEATIQRVISAGRRNTTVADVAREAGVATETVERVLQQHAPLVWRYRMRGGLLPVGKIIANVAGDWEQHARSLYDNGLRSTRDFDELVVDYGAAEVARWLERLERDHVALRDLRRELRKTLERT